MVACIQEVTQRLEKDNERLREMTGIADKKIVEVDQLAGAARETQTKKRNEAKGEKYDLQKEVVEKANEEREE